MLALVLVGCTGVPANSSPLPPSPIVMQPLITSTVPATPSQTFTPTVTLTLAPTLPPTLTVTTEPAGCRKPPNDYTRIEVNGWTLNARTLAMLAHTQELYGGEIELTGHAITQGSYHDNGSASFGTHLGGGAVDLSVLRRGTYTVLWDDVEPLIHALRLAGFAAWLRQYGELYADSPIHIHAIAIGDRELSDAAEAQLTGPAGYFRGFSGLVDANGSPTPDRHEGPILCQWMIELGYEDLRSSR